MNQNDPSNDSTIYLMGDVRLYPSDLGSVKIKITGKETSIDVTQPANYVIEQSISGMNIFDFYETAGTGGSYDYPIKGEGYEGTLSFEIFIKGVGNINIQGNMILTDTKAKESTAKTDINFNCYFMAEKIASYNVLAALELEIGKALQVEKDDIESKLKLVSTDNNLDPIEQFYKHLTRDAYENLGILGYDPAEYRLKKLKQLEQCYKPFTQEIRKELKGISENDLNEEVRNYAKKLLETKKYANN